MIIQPSTLRNVYNHMITQPPAEYVNSSKSPSRLQCSSILPADYGLCKLIQVTQPSVVYLDISATKSMHQLLQIIKYLNIIRQFREITQPSKYTSIHPHPPAIYNVRHSSGHLQCTSIHPNNVLIHIVRQFIQISSHLQWTSSYAAIYSNMSIVFIQIKQPSTVFIGPDQQANHSAHYFIEITLNTSIHADSTTILLSLSIAGDQIALPSIPMIIIASKCVLDQLYLTGFSLGVFPTWLFKYISLER